MDWLNYHHLFYFWTVAREKTLAAASTQLRLAPSTISEQIRALEVALGEKLFVRSGRGLVLTEMGQVVLRYAEDIFALGNELQDAIKGRPLGRPLKLLVGIADVVPKLVARRLLEPALKLAEPVHLICRENKPERLLAELVMHELDVVITDAPVSPAVRVKVFNHLLGESGIVFLGTKKLVSNYRQGFPKSLDRVPMILPTENTTLRRSLEQWFTTIGIRPKVVGEFEDSALLKVFGQSGLGVFPISSVVATEVQREFNLQMIGKLNAVRERFYAISIERKLKHPAVVAISEEARQKLFG